MLLLERGIFDDFLSPMATLTNIVFPWLRPCLINVCENLYKKNWNISMSYNLFQNGLTSKVFTSTLGFSHTAHPMVQIKLMYLKYFLDNNQFRCNFYPYFRLFSTIRWSNAQRAHLLNYIITFNVIGGKWYLGRYYTTHVNPDYYCVSMVTAF